MKLGLDFGNNTICAVGEIDGTIKTEGISSTFSPVNSYTKGNVISIKDEETIQLGEYDGNELTTKDKTKRPYVKHQILWAAYSIYGECKENHTHYIELGTGLPIDDYGDTDKKDEYEAILNNLGTFEGTIDGKRVAVNITKAKVYAESFGSVKALCSLLPKDYPTLIYDIGFGTSDVIQAEYIDGKLKVKKPVSVDKGINHIYETVFQEAHKLEAVKSMAHLDYFVRRKYSTIRTKAEDFPLQEKLKTKKVECQTIINDIGNKLGFKTTTYNKIFIGGGSVLIMDILGKDWIKNHIDIEDSLRYSANALGYFMSI